MISKYMRALFLFLFFSINLFAIEGKIRVFIKPEQIVYTSQKLVVSIEVLTNAFSISNTKIRFQNSQDYIVEVPKSASYLNTETINDENWQMVHYDYNLYMLKAGKIVIPPISIDFSASMGYGQAKKEFELMSESLSFHVKTPIGIKENQFALVTDAYSLEYDIKPMKKQFIVGDAIEITLIQKAQNVPDILLRPINYKSIPLLRIYKKEPELKSKLKGQYDVSRTDRFTFVASAEGNVTVAKQKLLWWNPLTQKIQVETIPEISFEILPDPQIAIDIQEEEYKKRLAYLIAILFLFLILYKIFVFKIRDYFKKRQQVYMNSEAGKYDMLLKSIKKDDVSCVYKQMYIWLLSISTEFSSGGFTKIKNIQPSFRIPLSDLENKLVDPLQKFDKVKFIQELSQLRATLLNQNTKRKRGLPLHINPH